LIIKSDINFWFILSPTEQLESEVRLA